MTKTRVLYRCASEIAMEPVQWIWPGQVALGKHTCIAGEPGTGKSQLTIDLAARVSMGAPFPCGEGVAPRGSVIILSAEDSDGDTVVPRLHAAGADLGRVNTVKVVEADEGGRRAFNLQADLAALERMIVKLGDVQLVVIDPISSYLGRGLDSHRNSDVRGVLEPLSEMAERLGVAIVSVTHFSKSYAGNVPKALHRFIGSIAFVAAPRIAFAVLQDQDNSDRRLLLHAKNNLSVPPQGLAFRLRQTIVGAPGRGIVASYVDWESEPVDITANEAMAADNSSAKDGDRREAMQFLAELLAAGRMPAEEVKNAAAGHMITAATLRGARERLGVEIKREGFGKDGVSYWSLPSTILARSHPENGGNAHTCLLQGSSKYGKHGGDGAPAGPEISTVAADLDAAIAFEERSAIREYDGELDRQEAEAAAADEFPDLPEFLRRKQDAR